MLGFEFFEKLFDWSSASFSSILKTLANPLTSIRLRSDVQQTLICLRILNNRGSFPINS